MKREDGDVGDLLTYLDIYGNGIKSALAPMIFLAGAQLREIGSYCEKTASASFDAIIENALTITGLSQNNCLRIKTYPRKPSFSIRI